MFGVVILSMKNQDLVAYKNNQIIYLGDSEVKHWDDLTPNQLRIAMFSAAKVQPNDTHETKYTMTFQEFADLCKFEETGGKDYQRIFREARKLSKLGVDFVDSNGDWVGFNWLNSVRVSPKSGTITYKLDEVLLPFYKTKKGSFAIINLIDYMPLRGRYALLLFEFLAKWQNDDKVYQAIEDLRKQLQVPIGKYKRTVDFMRRVVDGAVDEINKKAQYSFHVRMEEKFGRRGRIEGVTFYIDKIKQLPKPPLENQDLIDLLKSIGIDPPAAHSLVKSYSRERICANIELAKQRKIKTTLAALVSDAITSDYAEVEQVSILSSEKARHEIAATSKDPSKLAKADCPDCDGTGRVRRWVADQEISYTCQCTKR